MAKKERTVKEIMNLKKSNIGPASHVPVLVYLASKFNIETVVEIGSGPISTRLFLDKKYFKDLKNLVSYEHREGWYKKVMSLIDDERLDYRLITKDVKDIDLTHSGDLLFLDGLKFHRNHGAQKLGNNFKFVVIHDRDTTGVLFKYKWRYNPPKSYNSTFVMSNTINLDRVKWNCIWDKKLINELCKL